MSTHLDFETQLHCVPVRNQGVTTVTPENNPGVLVVEVRLRYTGLLALAARLFKTRRVRRYELAGLSRELYEKLDGKRTLEDLVNELAIEDKLTFFEARALMVQYLKDLMQRGLAVVTAVCG